MSLVFVELSSPHKRRLYSSKTSQEFTKSSPTTLYTWLSRRSYSPGRCPAEHRDRRLDTPSVLPAALEEVVPDSDGCVYFRILGWWLLLQAWGTVMFAEH